MLPSPVPLVLGAALLQWIADDIPTFNVEPGCRAAAKMGDSLSLDTSLRQCLADENGARAQLEKQWAQYPQTLRQRCTATAQIGGNPSYVELLVCLQMGRDASQMNRASSGSKPGD
ncbi:MAG TPA: hypothetical protein VH934_02615 [Xanthobacteraceae bacterium]